MSTLANINTATTPNPERAGRTSLFCFIGLLLTEIIILVLTFEPITQHDSHYNRMLLAGISLVLFIAYILNSKACNKSLFSVAPQRIPRLLSADWILQLLVATTCIFGIFNYYQFDKTFFTQLRDNNDTTYYYLNSKYFKELDYFNLYPAILIADEETENRLRYIDSYRDLHDYQMVPRSHFESDRQKIKNAFAENRWESFRADVDYFLRNNKEDIWKYFFIDHGYNPPPTWTVTGGFFSGITPVEHTKIITMLDLILICVMFITIARTFGISTMSFCLLFFLCTFSGRWPIAGESLLRFDWLVALVLSVCMLKREHYLLAGALLAYSALNRVFPAIFFFPYMVYLAYDFYKHKKLARQHIQFITGAAILTTLLIGLALILYGPDSFKSSYEKLTLHSDSSYSSHRVGLGQTLVYRGERDTETFWQNGGIDAKQIIINNNKPLLNGLGLLSILLIAWWVIKKRNPVHEYIHLAMIPLFCMTIPQINYFNMRQLLIIQHMSAPGRPINTFGITLLFLIEVLTQYTKVAEYPRYTTTSVTAVGLTLYFLVMISYMLFTLISERKTMNTPETNLTETASPASPTETTAHPIASSHLRKWAWVYILAGNAAFVAIVSAYWHYGPQLTSNAPFVQTPPPPAPPPQQPASNNPASTVEQLRDQLPPGTKVGAGIEYRELGKVKESGDSWRAEGAVVIPEGTGLMVILPKVSHSGKVDISFDNNDIYNISYNMGDKVLGTHVLTRPADGVSRGLQRTVIEVPTRAQKEGYDRVLIEPTDGDQRYSIGHFIFVE